MEVGYTLTINQTGVPSKGFPQETPLAFGILQHKPIGENHLHAIQKHVFLQ